MRTHAFILFLALTPATIAAAAVPPRAALARAKQDNTRVLVQWGGNWCVWCVRLHELCQSDKELARELSYEYEVVKVDIGKWDKNLDLAAQYSAAVKESGVPFLTVLDSDGKVIVNQESGSLEVKGEPRHDPAKVLAFFKQHQAPYLDAGKLYADALASAKAQGKRLFLHSGTPWCGWCRRLEAWMAQGEVNALLSKDFVELALDEERTIGGKELAASNDLDSPKAPNTGFPQADDEVAWFVKILGAARQRLTDQDIGSLKASLLRVREEREARQQKAG